MRQVRKKRETRCFYVRANDYIINRKYKRKWRFEVKMEHEKIIHQFLIGQTWEFYEWSNWWCQEVGESPTDEAELRPAEGWVRTKAMVLAEARWEGDSLHRLLSPVCEGLAFKRMCFWISDTAFLRPLFQQSVFMNPSTFSIKQIQIYCFPSTIFNCQFLQLLY